MTLAQLAEKTGQSRQNMSNKMSRDNFSEKELYAIAEALECTYEAQPFRNSNYRTADWRQYRSAHYPPPFP